MRELFQAIVEKNGQLGIVVSAIGATLFLIWRHFTNLLVQTRAPVEQWERLNEARVKEINDLRGAVDDLRKQVASLRDELIDVKLENAKLKARLARHEGRE